MSGGRGLQLLPRSRSCRLAPAGLREGAGDAGADTGGGVVRLVAGHLRDTGEPGLGGLQGGHGALVVQAVEDLAVVHHLRLVLGVGQDVQHVLAAAHHVEVRPLEDVGGLVLGDVAALDALPVMADDGDLHPVVVLPLPPAPPDVAEVLRLCCWSQVEGANVSQGRSGRRFAL